MHFWGLRPADVRALTLAEYNAMTRYANEALSEGKPGGR